MRVLLLISVIVLNSHFAAWATDAQALPEKHNSFTLSVPTAYMDDPRREEWQLPDRLLDYLLIKEGETVVDIGAGTGYFSVLFARKIGRNGIVYC